MTKYIAMIVINLVTPKAAAKRELLFNKPASPSVKQWLMLSSSALCVSKFIIVTVMNLVVFVLLLKSNLETQQTKGGFVEKKLLLDCIFRFGQIHNNQCYNFGHTLFCYLSQT